jgi:drug/metabolite transporter (DMT)-like permease
MSRIDLSKRGWQWATLLLLSIIWGTSFILMKKGLISYSSTQVAAFRMFFSFIIVLPLAIRNIRVINKRNIRPLLLSGLLGFAIPALLFTKAQTRIDSSLAGMLNSLTPLFTLIFGLLIFTARIKYYHVLGILIGLAGATGLIWKRELNIFEGINAYALLVVVATICYGINVNIVKFKLAELTSVQITSLSFLFVGPVGGIYLLFSDFSGVTQNGNYILNLVFIALLALLSSVLAVIIFNSLIKYTTAIFASSVTYIIPVFATLWGIFDGEIIRLAQLLWLVIILGGIYLVNKS